MKANLPKLLEKKDKKANKSHDALLRKCRDFIERSRKAMSKEYPKWDEHDAVFRSLRPKDKEDRNAQAKGQPAKMIVPLVKAQVLTYVSYAVMTVTQNARFFGLEPTGTEDDPLAEPMELVLERDMRKNSATSFLVQFFLDQARFTLGCAEVSYEERTRKVMVEQEEVTEQMGGDMVPRMVQSYVDLPVFVGNKIHSISPYRFFPDTNLPLDRYQEGEFCGSEDFWTYSSLKADPNLFNLDVIPKLSKNELEERKKCTRGDFSDFSVRTRETMTSDTGGDGGEYVNCGTVLVTKVVVDLIPKDVKLDGDERLGEEDFPVRFLCWYANDKVIIRFEPFYCWHSYFPYICAPFLPDQHKFLSDSLADDCAQLSSYATWLMNAHVTSVRNSIESRWIVDPAMIDTKTLDSRTPYIFLKRSASQMGIDRGIKQFQTQDATANTLVEVGQVKELMEYTTSFGNMMAGQFSQGRRDATQSRAVAQGQTARGKMLLGCTWDKAFEPLGRILLANNRQEMSFDTFSRIVGKGPFALNPETGLPMTTEDLYALFHADAVTVAMSEDFFVFDGTLPSEKAFLAQSLQEILTMVFSNPEIAAVYGIGPEQVKRMLDDIYNLRGVTNSRLPAPTIGQKNAPPPLAVLPPPNEAQASASAVSNGQ